MNFNYSVKKKVVLALVQSQVDIKLNEKVYQFAEQALNFNVLGFKVPYTDCTVNVNSILKQKLQDQWNGCPDIKQFPINPTVGEFYV